MIHFIKSDAVFRDPGVKYNRGHVKLSDKKKGEELPHVRHTSYRGLPINIELDRGMTASGIGPSGEKWKVKYKHPYGEIAGTEGADKDPVDIYLGYFDTDFVYIVHQVKPSGKYDEDKVFLGFRSPVEATRCYFEHGPKWGFGSLETMTFDQFKHGYLASNRNRGFGAPPPLVVYPHDDF